MGNATNALHSYREFLETIPLDKYREKFKAVKWVEQDLPREILPQWSIFMHYWDKQSFLDFDSWFEDFWQMLHSNSTSLAVLKDFKKYYFDKDNDGWFKLGFRARMYRTWTAVLTQLDFCYMFAYVCEKKGKVVVLECNADLDIAGVDLRVGDIDFGVGKISQRKEARSAAIVRRNTIQIPYAVFNVDDYVRKSKSPRVSEENRIAYQNALKAFYKYFVLLKNGFVCFGQKYVDWVVENLEDPDQLKKQIKSLLKELSGE